jgi:hypothetical protein
MVYSFSWTFSLYKLGQSVESRFLEAPRNRCYDPFAWLTSKDDLRLPMVTTLGAKLLKSSTGPIHWIAAISVI